MIKIERAAERILEIGKDASEADIRNRICYLFEVKGITEYRLEHRVSTGSKDIYFPRLRMVIEVKRTGLADNPKKASGKSKSPFRQLDDYLQAEIEKATKSQSSENNNRRWTGILTDGKVWHHWSYEHRDKPVAQPETESYRPKNGTELVTWLEPILAGELIGKQWIPSNPVDLFQDHHSNLRELFDNLPDKLAKETITQRKLWGDMLRSSGMYPVEKPAQFRLFVSHSFLVALARGVIWTMSNGEGEPDAEDLLGDGFVSWIVKSTLGQNWANDLLKELNLYDWQMRQGDVLRPLYEAFVSAEDRRDFGEVYTPDWLAELMVKETLDDNWCKTAIEAALDSYYNKTPIHGTGVLDPACGSGTFLYHATRHLLSHKEMLILKDGEQTEVVTRLINGIDIHPVACEFSRATVRRALPTPPPSGIANLRIYNGDSLQLQGADDGSLFAPKKGEVHITSPGGTGTVVLRESFYGLDNFAKLVEPFTASAMKQEELPTYIINAVENDEEVLVEAHDILKRIIKKEGNSVWNWYFVNAVGPYALGIHKIDRIVSNPPWVPIAGLRDERRDNILNAANQSGLRQGGKYAPKFDIAQLFVKKCREKYLSNPKLDPASWVVKASAIKSGQWENFRTWRLNKGIHRQSIDLSELRVFEGGDSNRSCILFDIRASSLGKGSALTGRWSKNKAEPHSTLEDILQYAKFERTENPYPQESSYYLNSGFRQGATFTPNVLTMVESVECYDEKYSSIRMKPSPKKPWGNVQLGQFHLPSKWLKEMVPSRKMLPFSLAPGEPNYVIVPTSKNGKLLSHNSAIKEPGWEMLNTKYDEFRGQGQNTPGTLVDRINYQKGLSNQLPLIRTIKRQRLKTVLYPLAGDIMRSCRIGYRSFVIPNALYYCSFHSENEAAYLTALLNTPSLRQAFKASQSSGRNFHLQPWRCIPIPEFNPDNDLHQIMAQLTVEAEEAVSVLLTEIQGNLTEGQNMLGQVTLSEQIRGLLLANGITDRLNETARQILPNHVR